MKRHILDYQVGIRPHPDQNVADADVPRQAALPRTDLGTKHRKVAMDEGNETERNPELAAQQVRQMVERRVESQTVLMLHRGHLVLHARGTRSQAQEFLVTGRKP